MTVASTSPPPSRDSVRSGRKRAVRAKVEQLHRMPRFRLRLIANDAGDYPAVVRPRTRADCERVSRLEQPCPFVSCRHHTYLDAQPGRPNIRVNFPDLDLADMPPGTSCSLDVADRGGVTLEEMGGLLNIVRERVRQLELLAVARYLAILDQRGLRKAFEDWLRERTRVVR